MPSPAFDVIVVGAGSAGCALAARLTEDPARRVLLLEAGPHYASLDAWPQELLQANTFSATLPGRPHNWSFTGTLLPGRRFPVPRGKVVGGSSAVNGTYFIRGRAEDFDAWAGAGNTEWSQERVLPFLRRCERDLDFGGDLHGADGPVPIRRAPPAQWRPVTQAFVDACLALGFPLEPDKNGQQPPGVGPIPRNCIDGIRQNAALTHLQPALQRPNLELRAEVFVRRVLFEGDRAVGVEVDHRGTRSAWHAGEVVLCAGGLQSPHLLMLSGIGDAAQLRSHGIAMVHDNPNVGRHLMDHSSITLPFRIAGDGKPVPEGFMPIQACLNYTTPGSREEGDNQIACVAASMAMLLREPRASTLAGRGAALLRNLAMLKDLRGLSFDFLLAQLRTRDDLQLNCSLMRPHSRGELKLASADPHVPPAIEFNYLSQPHDRAAVRYSLRTAADLLRTPSMRKLGAVRTVMTDQEMADDATLDAWIAAQLGTAFHTACTARMGPDNDPQAVVDQFGRVRGVRGLRVADLSICPTIVRRGCSATAILIGERVAGFYH